LGDLTGIRETIDYGSHANQRLHAWPFAKLTDFIRYKASLVGITVETLDESSTSRTCSACGHRKTTPVKGRRFVCLECGCVLHRDLNGARNIYHRAVNVSPDDGSRGALAVPAVVSWLLSWHTVCEPASSVSIASAVA
jgi:transposase